MAFRAFPRAMETARLAGKVAGDDPDTGPRNGTESETGVGLDEDACERDIDGTGKVHRTRVG